MQYINMEYVVKIFYTVPSHVHLTSLSLSWKEITWSSAKLVVTEGSGGGRGLKFGVGGLEL